MRKIMWMALGLGLGQLAWADSGSLGYSTNALRGSLRVSGSVAYALAASGQVTLAVSVAPLAIGASVGLVGLSAVGASSATTRPAPMGDIQPIGTPLPISAEVLTITPPNVALKPTVEPQSTFSERKP